MLCPGHLCCYTITLSLGMSLHGHPQHSRLRPSQDSTPSSSTAPTEEAAQKAALGNFCSDGSLAGVISDLGHCSESSSLQDFTPGNHPPRVGFASGGARHRMEASLWDPCCLCLKNVTPILFCLWPCNSSSLSREKMAIVYPCFLLFHGVGYKHHGFSWGKK